MRITRLIPVLAAFLISLTAVAGPPSEVLVKFQPGVAADERRAAHQQANGRLVSELSRSGVSVIEVGIGSVAGAIAVYERNPNVIYAEPNFSRPLFRPVTTEGAEPALGVANNFDEQWGLHNIGQGFGATTDPIFGTLIHPTYFGTPGADINAPEGWGSDRFGSPLVRIAVLDSGVACDHVDLAGKCWDEQNFVAEHGSTLEDVLGHGTHVAGIAAAHTDNGMGIAGVGRSTGIGAMKVCWEDMSLAILGIVIGQCDDADVVEAIEYVINSGEYQVINMSLAGPEFSITLQNAIDDAWAAGIVVVAGAGNEYTDTLMYPAAYANAIAVGATDQHDNLAAYSTFGDWVSVLAPGSTILSTIPGGFCGQAEGVPSDCYDWKSGTSMATPHVAGLAALLWAHLPAPTNQEVRSIIETSADSSGALAQNFSAWVQHGRINMAAALMDGGSPPPPPPPPPAATTHHVASISVSTVSAGKGRKHARAQIQVLDDLGDPVAGATVSGSFTGSFGESGSAVTNGSGIAVITTGSTAKGGVAFTFCVDNVTASGTSYDEESNATICQTF